MPHWWVPSLRFGSSFRAFRRSVSNHGEPVAIVHEPAKPSKTVGHSIETISTGVALCSYGYGRNHVGTMNGAISGIRGAGHGMAERDAAGCPSKSSPALAHGY